MKSIISSSSDILQHVKWWSSSVFSILRRSWSEGGSIRGGSSSTHLHRSVTSAARPFVRSTLLASAIISAFLATHTRTTRAAGLGSLRWEDIPPEAIDEIRRTFDRYANITNSAGVPCMDYAGFYAAVSSPTAPPHAAASGTNGAAATASATATADPTEKQIKTLFSLADKDHDQLLTFEEFLNFEVLMTGPEADYHIAFEFFDNDRNGLIKFDEFQRVLATTRFTRDLQFNCDCEWVRSFFGVDGQSSINYPEFTQLLKGLEGEVLMQAFHRTVRNGGEGSGEDEQKVTISAKDFSKLLLSSFSQRILGELPLEVQSNLTSLVGTRVTFSEFIAFYNVLMNLDRVREGIILASEYKHHPQVTSSELLRVTRRMHLFEFTPLETDIVYRLIDTDHDGFISVKDFDHLHRRQVEHERRSIVEYVLESVFHFVLGAVAGAIGAGAVYPIDLVKTRMQNQRFTKQSEKLYNNSLDCFLKVVRTEGITGLYRGLLPQLVGVAPEKAIKLTVNDLLRSLFGQPGGHIFFPLEILAGGCAGASQVIFTNPIEIVKIRLQVQGEAKKFGVEPKSTTTIIRELGFRGLYKGASACLLRDIPFSAIYFPVYAKTKEALSDPTTGHPPSGWNLLLAGALAGVPAASLVTPADVIKTRLQVEARTGQQTYKNIPHCAVTIFNTEGFRAFWKGAVMRVCRSSPQFGVTLLSYEMLQRYFMPSLKRPNPPTNAPVHTSDYDTLFRGGVGRSLRRTDQRWGLFEQRESQN